MDTTKPFPHYNVYYTLSNIVSILFGVWLFLDQWIYNPLSKPLVSVSIRIGAIFFSGIVFADFSMELRENSQAHQYRDSEKKSKGNLKKLAQINYLGDVFFYAGFRLISLSIFIGKIVGAGIYDSELWTGSRFLLLFRIILYSGMILVVLTIIVYVFGLKITPAVEKYDKKPTYITYIILAFLMFMGGESLINKMLLLMWGAATLSLLRQQNEKKIKWKELLKKKQTIKTDFFAGINNIASIYDCLLLSLPAFFIIPVMVLYFNALFPLWVEILLIANFWLIYTQKPRWQTDLNYRKSRKGLILLATLANALVLHSVLFYFELTSDPTALSLFFVDTAAIGAIAGAALFVLLFPYNYMVSRVTDSLSYIYFFTRAGDLIATITAVFLVGAAFLYQSMLGIPIFIGLPFSIVICLALNEMSIRYYIKLILDYGNHQKLNLSLILKEGYNKFSYTAARVRWRLGKGSQPNN